MSVLSTGLHADQPQRERLVQLKGRASVEQRARVVVPKHFRRDVEMKFVDEPGFQQREAKAPSAFAQHVGAARFLTQVFKDLYKILAAFPAVKASDADAAFAELGCAGRGGSGRRGEENRLRGAFLEQQQGIGRGHARGNGHGQRLAFDRIIKPCGQQWIIGMERVAADEDRASGPSHVGAEFVHLMAGRFSGDPAGMPSSVMASFSMT